jgi:DNA-binding NarL/FixJ family response regulator
MSDLIHLGIADDHLVLRQGLISLLKEYDNLNVIISANNGKELMQALKSSKPDIILLDIEMPEMNGREALERISIKYPKIKVIIMSQYFEDGYIVEFIKNGACAFLPKNCDIEKIVDAITYVHEHGYYFDNRVSMAMADMLKKMPSPATSLAEDADLTKQELKIIHLICAKKTNTEIAESLHLSVRTIESHRYNISKKTGTTNSIELMEYSKKNDLLKP